MLDTGAITNDGRNLLAMATAGNPIVFTECLTDRYYKSASQIVPISTIQPGMGDLTGTIYNTTFDGVQSALITMRFKNTGSGSTFSGAWIKGKLASQSDSDAVLFCAVMDNDGFYIPNTSTVDSYVDIKVYITFTDVGSTINIVESGGCTIEQLNAAINNLKAHGKDVEKTYDNFLRAQAYCKEGCGFSVDPSSPKKYVFEIDEDLWTNGYPTKYWITDYYDQYIVIVYTAGSNTYLMVFDITAGTIGTDTIYFDNTYIHCPMGDESSSNGNATILKVDSQYFIVAYTNSTSTNLWWYNNNAGQNSSDKATGRAAIMPLSAYYYEGTLFNKGWWYQLDNSTVKALRAVGGDFALLTDDISSYYSTIKLCRLSLQNTTSRPLSVAWSRGQDVTACIDKACMSYYDASVSCIDNGYILKQKDDFIFIGSFYDSGYEWHMPFGCTKLDANYQELSYTSTLNGAFLDSCGIDANMLDGGSQTVSTVARWGAAHPTNSAVCIQKCYDGFVLSDGVGYEPGTTENYAQPAIVLKNPIDVITVPKSSFCPLYPFFINGFNYKPLDYTGIIYALNGEPGTIVFNEKFQSIQGANGYNLLEDCIVRGVQSFSFRGGEGIVYSGAISCPPITLQFAPSNSYHGMKMLGKI